MCLNLSNFSAFSCYGIIMIYKSSYVRTFNWVGVKHMGKYLTETERYRLETMLKDKVPVMQIAERLGKHFTTIYKEIQKGTTELLNSDLTYRKEYCADIAQRITTDRGHNKGIPIKLGSNHKLAEHIEHLVKDLKYSPYAVACDIADGRFNITLCEGTIYNYIHGDVFLNISDRDLHYNLKHTKNVTKEKRPSYKKLHSKSIEERPKHIRKRETYGHWEMDTVYSGKEKGRSCLLVLTERMTREEIIRSMPDRTLNSTKETLDSLEREYGAVGFRKKFLSVTMDNGVEFGSSADIEKSCLLDTPRTSAYFCHPYCSSERGSNENCNGLIRYWIRKGEDIGTYTAGQIQDIQDWINNYPRKLFGGLSTVQYKAVLGIP